MLPSCEVDSLGEWTEAHFGLIFTFCYVSRLIKLHFSSASKQLRKVEYERGEELGQGVRSVIRKMHWVFSKVLLHWSPPTPHMLPVNAGRFFHEMAHAVSFEQCVLLLDRLGSVSTTLFRAHSELVSANKPFGIRGGNKSLLQKHPSVLNSPVDRWLSVSGNINIRGEKTNPNSLLCFKSKQKEIFQ